MCTSAIQDCPPPGSSKNKLSNDCSIGALFREYGEEYIDQYSPPLNQIKLIRAIRICKTPALGGKVITCQSCGHQHYIYFSCGHSHCPLCQSIKREQWVDKLRNDLFNVPYVHTVFTLPHQLNGIARNNMSSIYNLLMRSAWNTIKKLSAKEDNLGALPGMIAVLHTFGSDIKYHIHVHCLITFGGIDNHGQWKYPKRKNKIAPYRQMCRVFRTLFLKGLEKLYKQECIIYHLNYNQVHNIVGNIRWVVHNTNPTMDTQVLENYLSRYINRVAISKSRLTFVKDHAEVKILYNDYKNQQAGKAAPKAYRHLDPLLAINQILQHVCPPYFQKSRRYGLQSPRTKKRIDQGIINQLKRDHHTIRTVFQILKSLLGEEGFNCEKCNGQSFTTEKVKPNKKWILQYLQKPTLRPPPSLNLFKYDC